MGPVQELTWRRYQTGDIKRVNHSEPEAFPGWEEATEEVATGLTTIVLGDVPVAVFGCIVQRHGVAEVFSLVDRSLAVGHGKTIVKMLRAALSGGMRQYQIHRMQATVKVTDTAARVFLRAVGFRQESIMRRAASDGTDMAMMAKLGEQTT